MLQKPEYFQSYLLHVYNESNTSKYINDLCITILTW